MARPKSEAKRLAIQRSGRTHWEGCWRERGHEGCERPGLMSASARARTVTYNSSVDGRLRHVHMPHHVKAIAEAINRDRLALLVELWHRINIGMTGCADTNEVGEMHEVVFDRLRSEVVAEEDAAAEESLMKCQATIDTGEVRCCRMDEGHPGTHWYADKGVVLVRNQSGEVVKHLPWSYVLTWVEEDHVQD